MRLSLRKVGVEQATPGFCEEQLAFSSCMWQVTRQEWNGWNEVDCVVAATPLAADSLVLVPRIQRHLRSLIYKEVEQKNFTSNEWQLSSGFKQTGWVDFQAAGLSRRCFALGGATSDVALHKGRQWKQRGGSEHRKCRASKGIHETM